MDRSIPKCDSTTHAPVVLIGCHPHCHYGLELDVGSACSMDSSLALETSMTSGQLPEVLLLASSSKGSSFLPPLNNILREVLRHTTLG